VCFLILIVLLVQLGRKVLLVQSIWSPNLHLYSSFHTFPILSRLHLHQFIFYFVCSSGSPERRFSFEGSSYWTLVISIGRPGLASTSLARVPLFHLLSCIKGVLLHLQSLVHIEKDESIENLILIFLELLFTCHLHCLAPYIDSFLGSLLPIHPPDKVLDHLSSFIFQVSDLLHIKHSQL